MMIHLTSELLRTLAGKTLATAESCTGGMIGELLTAIPGSSAVYKGGIISYTNEIKHKLLGVDAALLEREGAVSAPVAKAMAEGARCALNADIAVSVTGLAGPAGDDRGNPVGLVYIGYADSRGTDTIKCLFEGDRDAVRTQAAQAAIRIILEKNKSHSV